MMKRLSGPHQRLIKSGIVVVSFFVSILGKQISYGQEYQEQGSEEQRAGARGQEVAERQEGTERQGSSDETTGGRLSAQELNNRIAKNEAEIQALMVEAFNIRTMEEEAIARQENLANELRIQAFQQMQQQAVAQAQMYSLSNQIRTQEEVIAARQQKVDSTVAPEDSDLMVSLHNDVAEAKRRLKALQDEYASIVSSQASSLNESLNLRRQLFNSPTGVPPGASSILQAEIEAARGEAEKLRNENK